MVLNVFDVEYPLSLSLSLSLLYRSTIIHPKLSLNARVSYKYITSTSPLHGGAFPSFLCSPLYGGCFPPSPVIWGDTPRTIISPANVAFLLFSPLFTYRWHSDQGALYICTSTLIHTGVVIPLLWVLIEYVNRLELLWNSGEIEGRKINHVNSKKSNTISICNCYHFVVSN